MDNVWNCDSYINIPSSHTYGSNSLSVVLVREGTMLTNWLPLVGEVSAYFCGQRGVALSARLIPTAVISVKVYNFYLKYPCVCWSLRKRKKK
jgi:hypothetical protein